MQIFQPGDKVRLKGGSGVVFLVVVGGYVETQDWHFHSSNTLFTSEKFEKVEG